ncbi:helix-turn-helix domain-containing protein [Variovorax sp. GB1P17]|uniref:helix-turn-helix domain-containing protein n=1 Tax=Variovorax sp. GB1P17 TaxID=3443740 RepID=UPI003F454C49
MIFSAIGPISFAFGLPSFLLLMPNRSSIAALSQGLPNSVDAGWARLSAVGAMAGSTVERLVIEPGLSVVRSSFVPRRDVREANANPPERGTLVLTVGLDGRSVYQSTQGEHLGFAAGFTTAAAYMGSAGERHYAAGERVVQLRLLIEEPAVLQWLGQDVSMRLMPARGVRALASTRTSAASSSHAQALYRSSDATGLAALDCRIHALSLLAEQIRALGLSPQEPVKASRRRDHDRLARARDLMHAQMDRPLTVAYLSAEVGMSETRFKAGFRDAFGISPRHMLLQIRMERARVLLDSGCQVAQTAWQVGYAHPGNFSTAFARYFGRAPKHQGL